MGHRVGIDCVLGYKVGGVGEAGDFDEATNVRDVTVSLEHAEADATSRANQGWRATVATLKDAEIETELVYDTEDAFYAAVRAAFLDKSAIGIAVMDGDLDAADSQGWVFDCQVMSFSTPQPMEDVVTVSVTLKPTYSPDNPPEYVEQGPNYTAP